MTNRILRLVLSSLPLLATACGGSTPTAPTPPPPAPAALTLACPAAVSAASIDGSPVVVTFAAPTAAGGTAPIATTCAPASGSSFAVGTTTSRCTATDAAPAPQTASCEVSISVSKVPRLSVTSIDAFGDSITEGGISQPCSRIAALTGAPLLGDLLPRPVADRSRSYPAFLQTLLSERYAAQNVQVVNSGLSGEFAEAGVDRYRREVLNAARPQVLLLQEGANDVNNIGYSRNAVVAALRETTRKSREAGIAVLVGTQLPKRADACQGFGADLIVPLNDAIRAMAAQEGATLVDLYAAFGGVPGTLIGPDGLHPTTDGYAKIAATFFDAIRQRFEN